ncbi:MAG: DUF503 domain-containing protein [Synergistaceae bacterium]|jgi:uncharacterized protein YlxP (DUF503 family)|nr:DUF503 domain-containing protein [Synergistaceae bacterium]
MKSWIGVVSMSMEILGATSLKDRRQVMRSLADGLRKHFKVSCADLGPAGMRNRADIAVAFVSSSYEEAGTRADQCIKFLRRAEDEGEFVIFETRREVFAYGDF